jgi:GAF domain-containing protein
MGVVIADQLTIWLENRQLLEETQYRSNLLQAAAEVSKQASSILDIDQLINTSVNFIRDQFNFYYVGMFLVDEAREWAMLRAGTGEAGRIQLEKEHRLEIGGGSMIGWCVQNRQARIALDVGKEAVHFSNPYLPDTRSELALPLVSRDEVIGALTVQSVEPGAFSDEDVETLQIMADQLANAIANVRFFAQTQEALSETETLYKVTQELLSANNEETVYKVAMEAIVQSGIDSSAIYAYVGDDETEQIIEQKAIWTITGDPIFPNGTRFQASDMVIEQLVPRYEPLLIEDIDNDRRLTEQMRRPLTSIGIKSLLALPLSTYQSRLGFVLIAYKTKNKIFNAQQMRFYNTIAQQMVAALANLRLLDASQRRAQREEIIREITGKIRGAINVDDVLKTTVTELSKVLGASRGGITLNIDTPSPMGSDTSDGESANDKSLGK